MAGPDLNTADLWDEQPFAYDCCELPLREFGGLRYFSGTVVTVRCHDDNGLVRSLLSGPGEGCVLVVDGGGSLRTALVGDVLGDLARVNGWTGIIVNGAVRDTLALAGIAIGVKALGTSPRRPTQTGDGRTDVPVTFGGVTFLPGSHLYSDPDGILISLDLS